MGASPIVQWLGSHALLWRRRVLPVWILGEDLAPLIKPCRGGVPHSRTTRIYNQNIQLCTGELWREEEEKNDWQQMLAQGQSLKINK